MKNIKLLSLLSVLLLTGCSLGAGSSSGDKESQSGSSSNSSEQVESSSDQVESSSEEESLSEEESVEESTSTQVTRDLTEEEARTYMETHVASLMSGMINEPKNYSYAVSTLKKERGGTKKNRVTDHKWVDHNNQKVAVERYEGFVNADSKPVLTTYLFKNTDNNFVIAKETSEAKTYTSYGKNDYYQCLNEDPILRDCKPTLYTDYDTNVTNAFGNLIATHVNFVDKTYRGIDENNFSITYTIATKVDETITLYHKRGIKVKNGYPEIIINEKKEVTADNEEYSVDGLRVQYDYSACDVVTPTIDSSWNKTN